VTGASNKSTTTPQGRMLEILKEIHEMTFKGLKASIEE
jgi:hypothetical protein